MIPSKTRRWLYGGIFLLAFVGLQAIAYGRDSLFPSEKPQLFAIETREHRFHHAFTVGTGIIPNDPVFIAFLLHASYHYQFNQLLGWTILDGFYGQNVDTGLTGYLAKYGARPLDQALQTIRAGFGSHFLIRPLYGKMAWFNDLKVDADTSLYVGPGAILGNDFKGQAFYFAPYAGISMDFWFAKNFSLRLDIRDYFAINPPNFNNLITLLAGITLQFGVQEEESVTSRLAPNKDL